jgi:hypothetical protein
MGSIPDEIIALSNWLNPSSHIMAMGLTQHLTEMSTWSLPGSKGRPAGKADNLTTICEFTVYNMREPRQLTALQASTACYKDNFTFTSK